MPITANKGEWSEFYTFLKILCDGKLPAADKDLKEIPSKYFIFHKVIREDIPGIKTTYHLNDLENIKIETDNNGTSSITIFKDKNLSNKTKKIFEQIKTSQGSAFIIPDAELLMQGLKCLKIKADSQDKADLTGVIEDRISSTLQELGFSIKSMVGGASTLLNAGDTTNFVFRINGFKGNIDSINGIQSRSKIRDRVSQIEREGGRFEFKEVKSSVFGGNLRKIDSVFSKIIASMLYDFFCGNGSSIKNLTENLNKNVELTQTYGFTEKDYELKIKNFLDAIALGMVPSKEWEGLSLANGGYIVVLADGSIVCYHLYNRDEFRSYLFENTKFETASSTRHKFGVLYEEDGELLFNLNLQIRF